MSGVKVKATAGLVLCAAICVATLANAQDNSQSTPAAPPEKETWKAPFGGTFTATIAALNDYSYRGISQTQRQVAVQASAAYETPTFSEQLPLTAYAGAWGSNVNFPTTGTAAEIDINAGFRLKALSDKLSFDLGYTRYNYPGAPESLMYGFNEFSFVAGYDFGVVAVTGAVRYAPNFFANSGNAWYKWGQIAVPLPFLKVNENVSFKAFGTLGNQYVERFTNYGIPNNNYWDWQAGVVVSLYGFDFTAAYTGTNLSVQDCLGTQNCASRVIVALSKTF